MDVEHFQEWRRVLMERVDQFIEDLGDVPRTPPTEEVVPSRSCEVPPRPQREWHRIFGADA